MRDLPGVFPLEEYTRQPERIEQAITNPGPRSAEVEGFCATLAQHWDRVAAMVTAPRQTRPSRLAGLLQRLPFLLEEQPMAERRSFFRWKPRRP
jgi:hypothetical protein